MIIVIIIKNWSTTPEMFKDTLSSQTVFFEFVAKPLKNTASESECELLSYDIRRVFFLSQCAYTYPEFPQAPGAPLLCCGSWPCDYSSGRPSESWSHLPDWTQISPHPPTMQTEKEWLREWEEFRKWERNIIQYTLCIFFFFKYRLHLYFIIES